MVHNGIAVTVQDGIAPAQAQALAEEETARWQASGKALASIDLALDGDDVVITAVEKSPIRRVRRITGYLSTVDHFNDAKRAELRARVQHLPAR